MEIGSGKAEERRRPCPQSRYFSTRSADPYGGRERRYLRHKGHCTMAVAFTHDPSRGRTQRPIPGPTEGKATAIVLVRPGPLTHCPNFILGLQRHPNAPIDILTSKQK
jgi:hypothetical protein